MTADTSYLRDELQTAHHELGEWAAVLKDWERASNAGSAEAIQGFLRVRVREHFLWEEQVLFPALLARNPALQDTVALLRSQHLELLKDIADLFHEASSVFLVRGAAAAQAEMVTRAAPLVERLLVHARLEDQKLLPRMAP